MQNELPLNEILATTATYAGYLMNFMSALLMVLSTWLVANAIMNRFDKRFMGYCFFILAYTTMPVTLIYFTAVHVLHSDSIWPTVKWILFVNWVLLSVAFMASRKNKNEY